MSSSAATQLGGHGMDSDHSVYQGCLIMEQPSTTIKAKTLKWSMIDCEDWRVRKRANGPHASIRSVCHECRRPRRNCLSSLSLQAHRAYERGDGASAHQLSEEGKRHGAMMDQYNKQASEYIFRENNAVDRVAGDTIDLHGQFVEEAEDILEQRIRYAQSQGQTHLHV